MCLSVQCDCFQGVFDWSVLLCRIVFCWVFYATYTSVRPFMDIKVKVVTVVF